MEFRVLGTVELWANGRTHVLGSLKQRLAFACMAYEIGRPVSVDVLIDHLWENSPPANARRILYSYVSKLRTTIRRAVGDDGPHLQNRTNAYVLDGHPHTVDAHRYASLSAQARSLVDSGDDEQAARLLEEASSLWRGEPLSGLPGLWAEELRTTLAHQSLAVAHIRTEIAFRRGHFADSVPGLASLVSRHPANETLAEHLMLALYGSGQPGEALRVYGDVRRRLVDELGSEPGRRLHRVHHGILHGVPVTDLLPGAAPAPQFRPFGGSPPNTLPRRPALVGRKAEMQKIRTALTHTAGANGNVVALEAIGGMAGVGKSALALHAAYELRDRFPDGQLFLDLHAHADDQAPMSPAAALDILLRSLGIPSASIPRDFDEATARWRAELAHRKVLILLDDVADAGQVLPLIPGGDSPSMLITTSRRRLSGIPELHHISLGVLPKDDAIALIRQQVGAERTANTRELADLIRVCTQLPLAITLAASRLGSHPSWRIADFTHRLTTSHQRLSELRDGTRGITRVFGFSYQRLNAAKQTTFRRLGLHIGPEFGPHAAAALAGVGLVEAESILETLLNYSLIDEPTAHRYRMHDLLREYARTLATTEEPDEQRTAALDRLLDFYLYAADRADRVLYSYRPRIDIQVSHTPAALPTLTDRSAARSWFAKERATLLTVAERAWEIGPPDRAALIANTLGGFLETERHTGIAESIHQRAVAHWRATGDGPAEARALIDLTLAHSRTDRYSAAIAVAEQAVALARSVDDDEAAAEALLQLATPVRSLGQLNRALSLEREALGVALHTGNDQLRYRARNNAAITLLALGEFDASLSSFEAALADLRASSDEIGQAIVLNNIGDVYRNQGAHDKARNAYEKSIELASTHGALVNRATSQMNLGFSLLASRKLDPALALYREALNAFRSIGERRRELLCLNGIGTIYRLTGRHDEALAHHYRALDIAQDIGAAAEEAQVLIQLGLAEHSAGRSALGISYVEAALEIARRIHAATETAEAQEALNNLR
jgi:DNA-binding SARP family transcriptional activator/tetratricopeptide (TPR) repeat protein